MLSASCILFPPARTAPVRMGWACAPASDSKCSSSSSSSYEALVGGRPDLSVPLALADLKRLIHRKAAEQGATAESGVAPTRVWLDLTNGESLSLTFEKLRDDSPGTCTLRVKQTRLLDECRVDDAKCVDLGCVAVRWNLNTREGVLVDLFKAQKGQRVGCDLSSADDRDVKWGELILRVVDDVASLLGCRHVYLADESSVRIDTWDPRIQGAQSQQVMLKYIRPLTDRVGYYEPRGYYTVDRALYYGFNGAAERAAAQDAAADGAVGAVGAQQVDVGLDESRLRDEDRSAREAASSELSAFDAVRVAPFRRGALASEIACIGGDGDGVRQRQESTLIYRFAKAVGVAQDAAAAAAAAAADDNGTPSDGSEVLVSAFDAAVAASTSGDGEGDGGPIAGHVASYVSLESFVERFGAALDAEVLAAAHLGEMVRLLRDRNREDSEPSRLQAGSLLLGVMFEFYAAYTSRKALPLKRKDYYRTRRPQLQTGEGFTDDGGAGCRTVTSSVTSHSTGVIRVDADAEHVPIIRAAYMLCGVDEEAEECILPWA